MGTSKPRSTPSGGPWTKVKRRITNSLGGGGGGGGNAESIVEGTIDAADGFSGYVRTGGGGAMAGAISGVGGFAEAVAVGGVDEALANLALDELKGHSAFEVIGTISEKITEGVEGVFAEQLRQAFRDAVLEAAAIQDDMTYDNLDVSLQAFMDEKGVEGFVELFLNNFVFYYLWALIEEHVQNKSENKEDYTAISSAVQGVCRSEVNDLIEEMKSRNLFDRVDWFGEEGQKLSRNIATTLERRLKNLSTGDE
ncbi:hypothetical protein KAR91_76870 [Candidatus Pacearchaeota archaeon]|nr:hypothetical protein [Candidatus Pacearchaeota archaeon]